MENRFLVTEKHGRVHRQVDPHTRVLVAIPGQFISVELAKECGLIPEPEPEPAEPVKDEKPAPVKMEAGKPTPALQTYPTRPHKGR